jgi:hypothetical protein
MKSIALFTFALALAPGLAFAQTTTPVAPPAADGGFQHPHPSFAQMQQLHAQMSQIHTQARLQILASLSPAHRALLANVIGQLAIAPNPDRAAAARALDAALTPGEARSILATQLAARTQSHTLMEAARAQFEASLSADQRAQMAQRFAQRPEDATHTDMQRTPDPGRTLLEVALGHEGHGEGHGFGPRGGFGPPPPQ